jgi:hypothetical protein
VTAARLIVHSTTAAQLALAAIAAVLGWEVLAVSLLWLVVNVVASAGTEYLIRSSPS